MTMISSPQNLFTKRRTDSTPSEIRNKIPPNNPIQPTALAVTTMLHNTSPYIGTATRNSFDFGRDKKRNDAVVHTTANAILGDGFRLHCEKKAGMKRIWATRNAANPARSESFLNSKASPKQQAPNAKEARECLGRKRMDIVRAGTILSNRIPPFICVTTTTR